MVGEHLLLSSLLMGIQVLYTFFGIPQVTILMALFCANFLTNQPTKKAKHREDAYHERTQHPKLGQGHNHNMELGCLTHKD